MVGFPYVGAEVEETPKTLTLSKFVPPTLWFTRNKPWLEHNNAEVSARNRFQLLIDYGPASMSSRMSQQYLDSKKVQHLPSSQQRALLLIKQPCLLKALCALTQQCLAPQHSKLSRLEKFMSLHHCCPL